MLFDPTPKTRIEDYFDNEEAIASLSESLQNPQTRLMVIRGPRRTGKTSLMHVTLAKTKLPYVFIDARSVEGKQDFYQKLAAGLKGALGGIHLSAVELGARLEFGSGSDDITSAMRGRKFVLVIDEAHLLSPFGLTNFLAYIYDNERGIKLLISGSEVGLLDRFLGQEDAGNPLFGRAMESIKTVRLHPNEASRFLKAGAEQLQIAITDSDIADAIANLDGIIGWLTLYGWTRQKMAHTKAVAEVIRRGILLTRSEFDHFLSTTKAPTRYQAIMAVIASGAHTWSGIKAALEKGLGYPVSDRQFQDYLDSLANHEFIDSSYNFVDPLLERSFRP